MNPFAVGLLLPYSSSHWGKARLQIYLNVFSNKSLVITDKYAACEILIIYKERKFPFLILFTC